MIRRVGSRKARVAEASDQRAALSDAREAPLPQTGNGRAGHVTARSNQGMDSPVTPQPKPPSALSPPAKPPGRPAGKHRRPQEQQATYSEVFRIAEFRALWLGQTMSILGDMLAQVALAVLVYNATGSAFLTATTYALTYLPPVLGGPLLSGLADRFPRRTVMVVCDVARAGLVATMAIPGTPFPVLAGLVFFTVLLGAPFTAARAALIPDVLHGDKYVVGSAVFNMTHQAGQMIGFVAGGGLVALLGPYRALALNAATFLAAALVLVAGVARRPAPQRVEGKHISLWSTTRQGARLVFGDQTLRTLVLFAWLCGFYVIPEGLAAPYAKALGGGPWTVGLLMAAPPTGTVLGALAFSRLVTPSNRIRAMGWLAMMSCAPLIVAAVRPGLHITLLLWFLSGVGIAYQLAANAVFVQSVPASGRAQAFGLVQSGLLAAQGIGILLAGAAAQILGPEPVVALAGVAGLACATMLTMRWAQARGNILKQIREQAATTS